MPKQVWKCSPRIVYHEVRGETMLFDPSNESIHVLNRTGAAIWQMCDGEHDVEAMIVGLQQAFTGTEGRDLQADVMETLRTFEAKGLLEGKRKRRKEPCYDEGHAGE